MNSPQGQGVAAPLDPAWLAGLRARAAMPPLAPRAALTIAAPRRVIGSIDAGLAAQLAGAGEPLSEQGSDWQVASPWDASLASIAGWLERQGRGGRWRNESLDVTDEQGQIVSSIERAAVRPLGITTFAVHLVVARDDGWVWVQQRALDKATDPGQWDTTMGGQVGAGESNRQALERETWEEAGLEIGQLRGLARVDRIRIRRPVPEGYMIEWIQVYSASAPAEVSPRNQDGEVHRFECLHPDELMQRLLGGEFTLEAALILADWLQRRRPA